ncbi:heterokaryon incompatibility, partial [Clohesyomyces aquaticus]
YATLSHCWGLHPSFLTLEASNLNSFEKGIPVQSLAQNFHNAIEVCKRLELRYLWIDGLCILQSGVGSEDDWLCHVTEMRTIYRNSYINISATA